MAWKDYESVSWFIQGSSPGDPGTQGSAVAVRLRRAEEDAKTYLLTCAHVVRGSSPEPGAGAVHKTLRAWRAGSGFTPDQARVLRVVASEHDRLDEQIAIDERGASFDWILLEIADKNEAKAAPVIPLWARPNPVGKFSVCGYPGGEESFWRGVVKPTILEHALILHDSYLGALRLNGDETRPGMSGGGLFDSDGVFVGIHRSKFDTQRKLEALSADFIRQRLKEKGFHVLVDVLPADSAPIAELANILGADAFRDVDWREPLNRRLPKPSTHYTQRNLRDDDALVASLRELEKLGPDVRGVPPLYGLALDLSSLKSTEALTKWIDENVSADVRTKFQAPSPAVPKGEPRIVIEMVPQGPPGDAPELRSVEYKIWFVGFQRSPPYQRQLDQLSHFNAVLASAWDAVRGQAETKSVWVELFIPKQLLAWKFESLDIRIGKFPARIGSTHPFVLRLMNREDPLRLEAEKFDRALCFHHYDSLDAIPDDCGSHVLVEAPGNSAPGDLFTALQGKESVLGVLWTSPPQTAENDDGDVWDAVSQAGVPLVLWLREVPELRADVGGKFHNKTWEQLAGVVKDLRNAGVQMRAAWHPGQHLAVILDDDRRIHPERIPLRSPHSP